MLKLAISIVVLSTGAALAQQTTVIVPSPGGGYTVNTPGRPSTYVAPSPGGGYTVYSAPGRPRGYIAPPPSGGLVYPPSIGR